MDEQRGAWPAAALVRAPTPDPKLNLSRKPPDEFPAYNIVPSINQRGFDAHKSAWFDHF